MKMEEVIETIRRHPSIWKGASIGSVILKEKGPGDEVEQWYNHFTKVILLPDLEKPYLEEPFARKNFRIIKAKVDLETLIKSLMSTLESEFFRVGPYEIGRLFYLTEQGFLSSDRAKREFGLEFSCNLWKMDSRGHYGYNDKELEPERESLPFRSVGDAIKYYVGMPRDESSYQYSFCLLAPYYYARLDNCYLKDSELYCMIVEDLSALTELVLRYNYRDKNGRTSGGSKEVENRHEVIKLEFPPREASVWLYHKNDFKIDERPYIYRTLATDELLAELSSVSVPYSRDEVRQSITKAIEHFSTSFEWASLLEETTEECVDSLDVEILRTIKDSGREYGDFMPRMLKWCPSRKMIEHLGKLNTLGCIEIDEDGKIAITPAGLDLLLAPPAVFVARVPPNVAIRIAEINRTFREGDFEGVINHSTRLLEHILRLELETKFRDRFQESWERLQLKPYDRAGLGELKEACVRLKVLDEKGFENKLIEAFLRIRVPISHETVLRPDSASSARITANLVDCFARYWYYVRGGLA